MKVVFISIFVLLVIFGGACKRKSFDNLEMTNSSEEAIRLGNTFYKDTNNIANRLNYIEVLLERKQYYSAWSLLTPVLYSQYEFIPQKLIDKFVASSYYLNDNLGLPESFDLSISQRQLLLSKDTLRNLSLLMVDDRISDRTIVLKKRGELLLKYRYYRASEYDFVKILSDGREDMITLRNLYISLCLQNRFREATTYINNSLNWKTISADEKARLGKMDSIALAAEEVLGFKDISNQEREKRIIKLFLNSTEVIISLQKLHNIIEAGSKDADFFAMRAYLFYRLGNKKAALEDITIANQLNNNLNNALYHRIVNMKDNS